MLRFPSVADSPHRNLAVLSECCRLTTSYSRRTFRVLPTHHIVLSPYFPSVADSPHRTLAVLSECCRLTTSYSRRTFSNSTLRRLSELSWTSSASWRVTSMTRDCDPSSGSRVRVHSPKFGRISILVGASSLPRHSLADDKNADDNETSLLLVLACSLPYL